MCSRAPESVEVGEFRGDGPLRQQLGSDASGMAADRATALAAEVAAARELALTTDKVR